MGAGHPGPIHRRIMGGGSDYRALSAEDLKQAARLYAQAALPRPATYAAMMPSPSAGSCFIWGMGLTQHV